MLGKFESHNDVDGNGNPTGGTVKGTGLEISVVSLQSSLSEAVELSEARRKDLSQSQAELQKVRMEASKGLYTPQVEAEHERVRADCDRFKAEVKRLTEALASQQQVSKLISDDRDIKYKEKELWKALAEKMAEALKNAKESNPAGLNTGIEEALQSFSDAKERGMK